VLEQRAQGRDDRERTRPFVKAPEREEPLVDGAARRRARLERHRLALGEREDALLAKPAGELGAPPARSVFARRDERDGTSALRDERRPRECPRARGRIGEVDGAAILKARGEVLVRVAPLEEREDAAKSRAGDRGGFEGGDAPLDLSH